MTKHLKYLIYVLRHKYFVYLEGRKLGLSRLQLLIHDYQKFMPIEWKAYVETFYGDKNPRRADGGYDPNNVSDLFDKAWLHHQKLGKHHWQYWTMPNEDGTTKALEIPEKYRLEMVADWKGAGRAQGNPNTFNWYKHNRDRMILHPITRAKIEIVILVIE